MWIRGQNLLLIGLCAAMLASAPALAKKKKKAAATVAPTPTCAAMDAIDVNTGKKKARKRKQAQKTALRKQLEALNKDWCQNKGEPYPYCQWGCNGGEKRKDHVDNNGNQSQATINVNPAKAAN